LIRASTAKRIARIEIHRPDKKNAFTGEMYAQLGDALAAAADDREVRVVLLHGSRDCFTSGNDIADFLKPRPVGREAGEEAPIWKLFRALPSMPKPVVAAVAGPAIGIGSTMLLHCDLVYAGESARFQLPFVPLGITPEFGSTFLLPRIAGYQRAAELLFLGQPFTAHKAKEVGIVNEVVPDAEVLARAEQAALQLAALPPASLRLTKELLKSAQGAAIQERIAEETRLFTERLSSPEAKEAMSAFLEKRKPDFSRF
jgi:enoyl-CoA hydratase/carnithine racemase